jgi:DNA 3'-phosphatase
MFRTLEKDYSNNWKDLDTLLVYHPQSFQFQSHIIILELDDCIIKNIKSTALYDTRNKKDIEFNEDMIRKILRDSTDKGIVILSNQTHGNKLIVDMVKRKLEAVIELTKLPIIAFFALKTNCFCKPHTGMWQLLNGYYRQFGSTFIKNAIIVSNEGGIINTKEKKNGDIVSKVTHSDIDRAFAWNIGCEYYTIDEYLDSGNRDRLGQNQSKLIKFQWNTNIISPEIRKIYVEEINKMPRINIFKELSTLGNSDSYVIFIFGAPRCGKTTLAKEIINKWRGSKFGEKNEIKRLGPDKFTKGKLFGLYKKYVNDRISVILDGIEMINEYRNKFISFINGKNISILYIEINIGLEMAKLFNHVCVEESKNDKITIRKMQDFYIYKSRYKNRKIATANSKSIVYFPVIDERKTVMEYRY